MLYSSFVSWNNYSFIFYIAIAYVSLNINITATTCTCSMNEPAPEHAEWRGEAVYTPLYSLYQFLYKPAMFIKLQNGYRTDF